MVKNQFTGKGVITFYNKEAAKKAVQARSQSSVNRCQAMSDVKLRVQNLPESFTEHELWKLFKDFDQIRRVKIFDRGSTLYHGEISFEEEEVGRLAVIIMDGMKICGG
jgi:RNA recognition motif-containing protein